MCGITDGALTTFSVSACTLCPQEGVQSTLILPHLLHPLLCPPVIASCLFTNFVVGNVGGGVLRLFSKGLIFAVTKPVSGPRGLSKQNTMS